MNLDRHEEIFRDRLQDHHAPVDTSEIWKSVQPHILSDKKKTRRPFLFWFLGISVFAGLFAGLLLIPQADTSVSARTQTEFSPLTNSSSAFHQERPSAAARIVSQDRSITTNEKNNPVIIAQEARPTKNHLPTITHKTTNQTLLGNEIIQDPPLNIVLPPNATKTSYSKPKPASSELIKRSQTLQIETDENTQQKESGQRQLFNTPLVPEELPFPHLRPLNGTERTSNQQLPIVFINPVDQDEKDLSTVPPLNTSTPPKSWSLLLHAGGGSYSSVYVSALPDVRISSDLNNAITAPSQGSVLGKKKRVNSIQFTAQKELGHHIYLESGISYMKLSETTRLLNGIILQGINANGENRIYVLDSTNQVEFITNLMPITDFLNFNRVLIPEEFTYHRHLIGIPLLVGYQRHWNQFIYGGFIGGEVSYLVRSKGRVNENFDKIETTADDWLQWRAMGGLDLGFQLTHSLSLSIRPTVSYLPDVTNRSAVQAKERLWTKNISLGVKLKL